jgi:hypothetical protein
MMHRLPRLVPNPIVATGWLQGPPRIVDAKLTAVNTGIPSFPLPKAFIHARARGGTTLSRETAIRVAFPFSAMAIAAVDRTLPPPGSGRGRTGNTAAAPATEH